MASIMILLGLPMIVGVRLLAKTSGADIAPEPGSVISHIPAYRCFTDGAAETRLTRICRSVCGEGCILVGKEEVTPLVILQICIGLGVFLIVYPGLASHFKPKVLHMFLINVMTH